jgi:hypothetical protein
MTKSPRHTVYNPRIATPCMQDFLQPVRSATFVLLICVLNFLSPAMVLAADWSAPESQLAGEIVAVTGPGTVGLAIANRSSLNRNQVDEITRGLNSDLASLGLHFVNPDQAAAMVTISLSEDLQNYVWVAEIHQGANESSVVMIATPRVGGAPTRRDAMAVTIHKALLWSQAQQILDVAIMDGVPTHMAVLSANQVDLYRLENGQWRAEQTLPVPHLHPWPRDLRGRMVLRRDHLLDAFLPGVSCRSTTSLPFSLNCFESEDPWPLGTEQLTLNAFFTPSRNYFTGALAPGIGKQTSAPAFYSAAALPRDSYTLWLFSAVDGQVHLLDGVTDRTAGTLDWGSDIAGVRGACGSGWNLLATSSRGKFDSLRAFEIPDREPVAISQPVEFPGPITALWTETSGNTAIAVSRDLETGNYEAFRLSFTCGL